MSRKQLALALSGAALLSGCLSMPVKPDQTSAAPATALPKTPQSEAAQIQGSGYSYRPLDPLRVSLQHGQTIPVTNCRILELLPDETVRLAIRELDASGNASYGPVKLGLEGHRYLVTLDYIKSDTFSVSVPASDAAQPGHIVPTYVGVGLRLSVDLTVLQGNVDLSNLVLIGAAGQAKQVSGTLVFQTLGISGQNVIVPVPSEISASSIQNALVAIGTIRSHIYDDKATISPRIVGIYDSFGSDVKAFDAYFGAVLAKPPELFEREKSSQCPASELAAVAIAGSAPGGGAPANSAGTAPVAPAHSKPRTQ